MRLNYRLLKSKIEKLWKRNRSNGEVKITTIGSCLSNFVVSDYLEQSFQPNTSVVRLSSSLQLRSDIVLNLLRRNKFDIELVERFLGAGSWGKDAKKEEYAQWFSTFIKSKIDESQDLPNDDPDLVVMDSLCDIRHSLYEHRESQWPVFFGNIQFNSNEDRKHFDSQFRFIGLLSPEEQIKNIKQICDFFRSKNRKVVVVYMRFPLSEKYLEDKWLERDLIFSEKFRKDIGQWGDGAFHYIEVPHTLINPVTDPTHPNYSPQVWNHFYPPTYEFFAGSIANIFMKRNK